MKASVIVISLVSALLILGRVGAADAAAPQKQTACPVMGNPINTSLFVDHDGKRIYVCCPGCLPKVKDDPAKYISKLEQAGVVLDKILQEKAQATAAQPAPQDSQAQQHGCCK